MTNWIVTATVVLMAIPSSGLAQSRDALIGTWKLVSARDTTDKGEIRDAFGRNPTGFLTYTADGRMVGIITFDNRKPLSVPDIISAPAEERAASFSTLIAYAGTYTFAGDRVIHHVEAAWMQNYVKTDQVRYIVRFQGDHLTLRTPPFLKGGVQIANEELVWERMKSSK